MAAKISQAARQRLLDIWDYTEQTWGEDQEDRYIRGLVNTIDAASTERHRWRPVMDQKLKGVFFIRYQHHYVFFRELSNEKLGVINILHENMDLPSRLKDDSESANDE